MGRLLGSSHPNILETMNSIAMIRCNQGRFDEASSIHKEVVETWTSTLGKDHRYTLVDLYTLGNALSFQGYLDKALRLQKEVLERGGGGESSATIILALAEGGQE